MARQGLEESASELDTVVTVFVCKGRTTNASSKAYGLDRDLAGNGDSPGSFALRGAFGRFFRPLAGTPE